MEGPDLYVSVYPSSATGIMLGCLSVFQETERRSIQMHDAIPRIVIRKVGVCAFMDMALVLTVKGYTIYETDPPEPTRRCSMK